ncbi:MAG: DNA protecting protein DprA [Chloroflexi bacterium RBG_13_48_17]|nr:MAG: DNA protecting protein DprA [Chloroflexi bacterium RBG_13_48_17]
MKYWVGFSKMPGIGRVKISQLLDHFNTLEHAWKASTGELKNSGLDSKTVENIVNLRTRIAPDEEIDNLNKYKIKVLPCDSPAYPQRLKEIYDYPPVLYIRGNLLTEDECCLAVVGTRRATVYGRQVTEEIVTDLARNGITIVSGLARGIDSVAHHATLEAGARTMAVFACGLDIVYPAENAKLAREIMEHGALISEYPPGTKPKADNFPRRNRIMSGLSLGVLVIEAGESSGALITANQALEQNREVFAVPGSILSPASRGTNHLIQEGAKLVRNYVDILEELNLTIMAQQLEMKELLPVDETESLLLKQLSREPIHIDDICRHSGLAAASVGSVLTMMELKGMVKQVGSMNYVLAREMKEEYQTAG